MTERIDSGSSVRTTNEDIHPLVEVRDLSVTYLRRDREIPALRGVDLRIDAGRSVAIVGESGSGKSTMVQSLLGILPASAYQTGTIRLFGHEYQQTDYRQWVEVRRRRISYIPQDPNTNLDPTMRIGDQIMQLVRLNVGVSHEQAKRRALSLLKEVGFDDPHMRYRQYPFELSGGLKQRVLIAQALVGDPDLIIADEPTSALDVTVQKTVLDKLSALVRERGIALIMVTHDLAVASDRASWIVVMHDGKIVEQGDTNQVLTSPREDYTKSLIEVAPAFAFSKEREIAVAADDQVGLDCAVQWVSVSKRFPVNRSKKEEAFWALHDVSLCAHRHKTLAIVGESGSGKTTLLRMALQLTRPTKGHVLINGKDLSSVSQAEMRRARRQMQLVQQNPFDSLDPRRSIVQSIAEPLAIFGKGSRKERKLRVAELLDRVELPQRLLDAKPRELSGGQCQRVAIARALALNPQIIMLDEPVSALDVSVQSQILDLLDELQAELGLTYVFVTHDLAVVAQSAHCVAVMEHGRVVEFGNVHRVLSAPHSECAQRLVDAVPGR